MARRRNNRKNQTARFIAIGDANFGGGTYVGRGETPEEAYQDLTKNERDSYGDGIDDDSVIIYKVEAFGKVQRKVEVDFLTVASL